MKLKTYKPLEVSLEERLPESADELETVREMIAFAESYGVVLSQHRRELLAEFESLQKKALLRLKDGVVITDDGEVKQNKEDAEKFAKMNADEKKVFLAAEVAEQSAELEYVTKLEELVKRRCSLGQSMLNSFNIELQSSWNK